MSVAEIITQMWTHRGAREPDWFKRNYEEAVDRVEDHTDDPENEYWHGPTCATDAMPYESDLFEEFGGRFSPEEARKMAFELLVLADLAEASELSK